MNFPVTAHFFYYFEIWKIGLKKLKKLYPYEENNQN